MGLTVTPNQSQIQTSLRAFMLAILPDGVEVIAGQTNRTPEPHASDFVVMTVIRRTRLSTNVDSFMPCEFTASISGNQMLVTSLRIGNIKVGAQIYALGIAPGTVVTGSIGSFGGVGTFQIAPPQTVPTAVMAAGQNTYLQPTEIVYQCDVHSPDDGQSADMAQTISTMLRDQYAVDFFNAQPYDVWPIHADVPRQAPFVNAENQYETRYIVEVHLQANQIISGVGQQAFDIVEVDLIAVETIKPVSGEFILDESQLDSNAVLG